MINYREKDGMVTNIRFTPKLLSNNFGEVLEFNSGWWLSYVNINDFFNMMPIKTLSLM